MQRPHHSFQAAVGPRHGEYPLRNPWVEKHPDSSSSSAGRSGQSLRRHGPRPPQLTRLGPPPASEWLRPGPSQLQPGPSQPRLHGPMLNLPPHPPRPRLSLHGSSPAESAVGTIGGGGGGECAACDTFCYHCLQVVYIAGILTGVSLTIAGSVLRGSPRRGDLLVLVYIGVLLAAVCALLLSVHYCVRRSVKERKRVLRAPRPGVAIPLQEFPIELRQFPESENLRQNDLSDARHDSIGLRQPRVASFSRSRSGHSSHGRRYYLDEFQERPLEEWERQPYQPLIHRPR